MSKIFVGISRIRKIQNASFWYRSTKERIPNQTRGLTSASFSQHKLPVMTRSVVSPALLRPAPLTCCDVRTRSAGDFAGAPPTHDADCELSDLEYEEVCEETLESLCEAFENIVDSDLGSDDYDVSYSSGVLTVKLGQHGTFVINKQAPNKQIWLSSPVSGPKRYDYRDGVWLYKHDGVVLHQTLTEEISRALGADVNFLNCSYGKKDS